MSENLWYILLPIVLFGFKNIFPALWEKYLSKDNSCGLKTKILEEIFQFPVDLLYIAISYTLPKIIETINALSAANSNEIKTSIKLLINYCARSFIMLCLLPLFVLFTKYSIRLGDEGKKCSQFLLTLVLYVISIVTIVYSLFLHS